MFEQLRQRLGREEPPRLRREAIRLEELRPAAAAELNLTWTSHFNTPELRRHLAEYPGLSLRVRGTTDYIIGENWRRRPEIGQITETRARHYQAELVDGLLQEYRRRGYRAVVVGHDEHSEHPKFYAEAGFVELERIVYYEKPDMRLAGLEPLAGLSLWPYEAGPAAEADLLRVDHAAFPWLWWNSPAELNYYRQQEGVSIWLGWLDEGGRGPRPVGYFGYTLYDRWAHLDRLAVVPELQGRRLGAWLLDRALEQMAARGARRVTLSTQLDNLRSQRLYEGFGFQRVKSLEYGLAGKWLASRPPAEPGHHT